jgi:hypothetical protein
LPPFGTDKVTDRPACEPSVDKLGVGHSPGRHAPPTNINSEVAADSQPPQGRTAKAAADISELGTWRHDCLDLADIDLARRLGDCLGPALALGHLARKLQIVARVGRVNGRADEDCSRLVA